MQGKPSTRVPHGDSAAETLLSFLPDPPSGTLASQSRRTFLRQPRPGEAGEVMGGQMKGSRLACHARCYRCTCIFGHDVKTNGDVLVPQVGGLFYSVLKWLFWCCAQCTNTPATRLFAHLYTGCLCAHLPLFIPLFETPAPSYRSDDDGGSGGGDGGVGSSSSGRGEENGGGGGGGDDLADAPVDY